MSENKHSEIRDTAIDSRGEKDRLTRAQTVTRILEVREGRQESFSSLLSQYKPLIEGAVARYSVEEISELSREDLRQEAYLAFYQSILSYDIEQSEVEFGLYAKICVTNGLLSRLRRFKRQAQISWESPESLESRGDLPLEGQEDPSERILEEERLGLLYATIRHCLSDYEYRVWSLYMSGRSAREIGLAVEKDEKSVANAIYRIRKKLRSELR